ncbi:MAG: hypothetical protein VKJ24_02450 [Synechococcales bacterium]|nr:hypothetical protein [Synechococcales bacterium]
MNLILTIAALVVSVLIFIWLVNVIKTTVKTALMIAAIVLLLQFLGIGPGNAAQYLGQFIQGIWSAVSGAK